MRGDTIAIVARTSRAAAWCCVLALVLLSWIPGDAQIRSGIPGRIEHVIAYAGTGLLAAFGTGRTSSTVAAFGRVLLGLVLLGGVLEIGQLWVPGRTAQLMDFAASATGAALGAGLGVAVDALRRRGARSAP